jgi:hypothetical protein
MLKGMRSQNMPRVIRSFAFAGSLLLMAAAPYACADTFNLTWTGAFGPGSAILTATNEGSGDFLVTAMSSGLQNGLGITLLPVGAYGLNDNQIFQPPNTDLLDLPGFAFSDGTNDYNLFLYTIPIDGNTYTECSSAVTGVSGCVTIPDFNLSSPVDTLSITPVAATPEPTSVSLLGAAVLGAVVLRRRRAARG